MFLYAGKILHIDLSNHTWEAKSLDPTLIKKYIGGRGLGIRLLYDLVQSGIDPLGADNQLFVGTGSFAGTLIPSSSRTIFMIKSPLGQMRGGILQLN